MPPGCELWLDGGHNEDCGLALARMASDWAKEPGALPLYLVFGMLTTKDASGFLRPLARHATGGVPFTVTPEAQALLQSYPWPGNVRELENVVQRAVVLSGGRTITPARELTGNGRGDITADVRANGDPGEVHRGQVRHRQHPGVKLVELRRGHRKGRHVNGPDSRDGIGVARICGGERRTQDDARRAGDQARAQPLPEAKNTHDGWNKNRFHATKFN